VVFLWFNDRTAGTTQGTNAFAASLILPAEWRFQTVYRGQMVGGWQLALHPNIRFCKAVMCVLVYAFPE
jgi:hypothetical protein